MQASAHKAFGAMTVEQIFLNQVNDVFRNVNQTAYCVADWSQKIASLCHKPVNINDNHLQLWEIWNHTSKRPDTCHNNMHAVKNMLANMLNDNILGITIINCGSSIKKISMPLTYNVKRYV